MLFQPHRCLSELVLSKHLRFMLVTITKWGLHINCPMSGAGNTSHSGEWLEGLQVVSLTANLQEVVIQARCLGTLMQKVNKKQQDSWQEAPACYYMG